MRCLCCGKEMGESPELAERTAGWHHACVRKFFGTDSIPAIQISKGALEQLAVASINEGYTVPGVQKKLSLHLSSEKGEAPRLTLVDYPSGFILKPQTEEFPALPEAEYLVMSMAKATKIKTVPFGLLPGAEPEEGFAYITRRIDRVSAKDGTKRFAMEDFCQLENRMTADKYKGSYERCAKVIARYSRNIGLDLADLYLRILFSFVTGNSDMHLKNFSLIETAEGSGAYCLSAAYDLLPVNVIMPQDTEQLALTLNGKKRNLRRKDFLTFADACGIHSKAAGKMIQKVLSMEGTYRQMCRDSYLPDEMKEALELLIQERMEILAGGVNKS